MSLADITDKFDFTFLCGDLNFRLDITRLHADWLISRKGIELFFGGSIRSVFSLKCFRLCASLCVRPTEKADGGRHGVQRIS